MVKETWKHETDYGTETAMLYSYGEGDYFVDMNCILWNRHYKSYAWAKKYLEKCGYEHIDTVIDMR